MRKLVLALLVVFVLPTAARADFGIGFFLGEPIGLDLKIGLTRKSGLDLLVGAVSYDRDRGRDVSYGHVTYLLTPFVGHGRSFLVPLRLGIGAAVIDVENDVVFGVRAPFEVGLRFRSVPLEIYGELALIYVFLDNGRDDDLDIQGGVGLRFYF
jgi:hypothetical protein